MLNDADVVIIQSDGYKIIMDIKRQRLKEILFLGFYQVSEKEQFVNYYVTCENAYIY